MSQSHFDSVGWTGLISNSSATFEIARNQRLFPPYEQQSTIVMRKLTEKKKQTNREAAINAALKDLQSGTFKTYEDAAKAHGIPRSTLSKRARGVHSSAREGHAHQQKLAPVIEQVLVDWCIFCGTIGIPWTKEELMSRAQELAEDGVTLSRDWYRRFLDRHGERLKFKRAYELDPKRASGFNRTVIFEHFEGWKYMVEYYQIPPSHQYNMDEKGIQDGGGRATSQRKHIFGLLQKVQYKFKRDSLELMTIIECICADGFAMKPTIVHQPGDVGIWSKDKRIACCVASENGWTSDDICESWFIKVFIPTAFERRESNAPITLLLDGHGSHISTRIREIAFEKRVFVYCLPPKTTHKTQPLDVGVFNHVQSAWLTACEESAKKHEPVSKEATIKRYMDAREKGMRPEIIIDAWRRTGHYPFNPDIFTDEDFAPSKVSSVLTHLPESFPALPEPAPAPSAEPAAIETAESASATSTPPEAQHNENESQTRPSSIPSTKLIRDDYIHDWHDLPLKKQVAGQKRDLETMWDAYNEATEEGQRLKAHLVMLTHENRQLREQAHAHKKPKRTASEATAASMAQRHGFLTNPEHEEAFRRGLDELEAKQRAEAEKTAQKEARAREIEENRSRIVANPSYVFEGTLQSFKHANMDRLGDLAACLGLPFTGLKKAEIFEKILQHFEAHPDFKAMPKFSNLFRTSRAPRRATVQAAGVAPVHSAEPADPGPPLPQLYTIDE